MFAAFAILFLGLLRQTESVPPNCEHFQPLDHVLPQDLEGQWFLVAGGMNESSALKRFKMRDSSISHYSIINGTTMSFTRYDSFNETCQVVEFVVKLEGSGFRLPGYRNITVIFMNTTCPDCLVINFDSEHNSSMPLYLASKRRVLEEAEMEAFKAQVKCLEMTHVELMDPTIKVCEKSNGTTTEKVPVEDGGKKA